MNKGLQGPRFSAPEDIFRHCFLARFYEWNAPGYVIEAARATLTRILKTILGRSQIQTDGPIHTYPIFLMVARLIHADLSFTRT